MEYAIRFVNPAVCSLPCERVASDAAKPMCLLRISCIVALLVRALISDAACAFGADAKPTADPTRPFFAQHCQGCHAGTKPKGNFRLESLSHDFADEANRKRWLTVLLAKLKQSQEGGASLLDRTTVFLGSNLGEASSHSVKNLPVLLAGGGFKHGRHLPFDPQNPPPLCNLYVSMLQRLGIETDTFSSGTGTLTGLEAVG